MDVQGADLQRSRFQSSNENECNERNNYASYLESSIQFQEGNHMAVDFQIIHYVSQW